MSVDAYAGIDPARKRCCAVGEVDADSVVEALRDGLIVVPVSIETARQIWGSEPVDIYAIAIGENTAPAKVEGLSAEQVEQVREVVQELAEKSGTDFDAAFESAMGVMKYHAIESVPWGKKAAGGSGGVKKG
jgi:hypothetical protein